jgi:hypothetical protein
MIVGRTDTAVRANGTGGYRLDVGSSEGLIYASEREIASLVVQLASETSYHMTATTFDLSGGRAIAMKIRSNAVVETEASEDSQSSHMKRR